MKSNSNNSINVFVKQIISIKLGELTDSLIDLDYEINILNQKIEELLSIKTTTFKKIEDLKSFLMSN